MTGACMLSNSWRFARLTCARARADRQDARRPLPSCRAGAAAAAREAARAPPEHRPTAGTTSEAAAGAAGATGETRQSTGSRTGTFGPPDAHRDRPDRCRERQDGTRTSGGPHGPGGIVPGLGRGARGQPEPAVCHCRCRTVVARARAGRTPHAGAGAERVVARAAGGRARRGRRRRPGRPPSRSAVAAAAGADGASTEAGTSQRCRRGGIRLGDDRRGSHGLRSGIGGGCSRGRLLAAGLRSATPAQAAWPRATCGRRGLDRRG